MSGLFDPRDREAPRSGIIFLQALILALFCIFFMRFWYLQVHQGHEMARKARENQLRREYVYAPWGLIRDANGILLATNEPAYALGLVREDCDDVEATLAEISRIIDIPVEHLKKTAAGTKRKVKKFEPLILVPDMTFEQLAAVEANSLRVPGMEILVRSRRIYKYGELFAHILGYVAEANEKEVDQDPDLALGDYVGRSGLEQMLERRLRGTKGLREFEVDVTGRRLKNRVVQTPHAGEDLTLTLDLGLQKLVTEIMKDKAGVVVVMEPDSGKLVALVSAPTFDSNTFGMGLTEEKWKELSEDPMHPLLNRVTQSAYPPGSVFKLVMAGCGLANDAIDPEDTVFCPGSLSLGRHVFRCWRRGGHGNVNLRRALVESCDVYFYRLGMKLGVDKISAFAKACGFGSPTGIDLPHEKGGVIPSREWKEKHFKEKWQKGEDLNLSIGQGYALTTPLQIGRYISALMNGGELLKPTLVLNEEKVVQGEIPLAEEHRELILENMVRTVVDPGGTCWRARTPGIRVGAKTGTAQVARLTDELKALPDEKIPYHLRDHAWMAGFAEKGDKRYVVVVMVEHGLHGSSGAGPVVRAVLDYLYADEKADASTRRLARNSRPENRTGG